jgi:hypothetical protein
MAQPLHSFQPKLVPKIKIKIKIKTTTTRTVIE